MKVWQIEGYHYFCSTTLKNSFNSEFDFFFLNNLFASNLSTGHVLAIGNYTFEITLKNGNSDTHTFNVPAPGSLTTNGSNFVFTENFGRANNPPANYTSLPKRATVQNTMLDTKEQKLSLEFSVKDSRIFSGWIRIYDTSGKYIGVSKNFRNYETGTISKDLNNGTAFHNNGTTNQLVLPSSQFNFQDNRSFKDLDSLVVVLTDGQQYAGKEEDHTYDTRSISSHVKVSRAN